MIFIFDKWNLSNFEVIQRIFDAKVDPWVEHTQKPLQNP